MVKRYLSPEEIRQEEIRLLHTFVKLCNERDLRYTLMGGTMLGAIRHQGFIPWDDDIDLGMPRPDYDRLIDLAQKGVIQGNCALEDIYDVPLDKAPFVKFVSRDVSVQERYTSSPSHLWIDIIPVDALPDSAKDTNRLYRRVQFRHRIMQMSYANPKEAKSVLHKIVKQCLHLVDFGHWIGRLNMRQINKIAAEIPYGSTEHVGALTNGLYGAGERMPIKGYEDTVEVTFEGERFKAMSCWDSYLTGIYGDYMTLPPVEKRVNHQMKAWRE